MAFDPFTLRPDSCLRRLPASVTQDTIDTVVETAAPLDLGTPEQQALRAAAAVELLEACRPADALQLMLAEHIATLHLGARQARRSGSGCMPGSNEESRCSGTAERQSRTMLACLAALDRRQARAAAAPPAAAPPAAAPEAPSPPPWPPEAPPPSPWPPEAPPTPEPEAQPEAQPAVGPDAARIQAASTGANDATLAPAPDAAPPELLVRKLPRPARPALPPLELPHWFWRPDGTRLDEPPQIWVDAHRLPDGTVPPWNRAAFDVMTMEERRAAWWYGEACDKAEADAIRLFGPGGPYEGQGWDWGLPPGIGIGGVPLPPDTPDTAHAP